MLEREVVIIEHFLELRRESIGVEKIGQTQRAPRDLVLVSRTDTAAGCADGALSARPLAGGIERHVIRQNQRTGGAYAKPLGDRHSAPGEHVHLLEQRRW